MTMKFTTLNKIWAIVLSLTLLISSVGQAMETHYCQGKFKGISFYGVQKSCHKEVSIPPCHKTENNKQAPEKKCCDYQKVFIDQQVFDAFTPQVTIFNSTPFEFAYALVAVFFWESDLDKKVYPFHLYTPPKLRRNLQAHFQTFII